MRMLSFLVLLCLFRLDAATFYMASGKDIEADPVELQAVILRIRTASGDVKSLPLAQIVAVKTDKGFLTAPLSPEEWKALIAPHAPAPLPAPPPAPAADTIVDAKADTAKPAP